MASWRCARDNGLQRICRSVARERRASTTRPTRGIRGLDGRRWVSRPWDVVSKPIPGSTGAVLTELPSPYLPHPPTGLLYLPRFLAKCRYVKEHGALPPSYAKNYKRGLDRFLCVHLGVDPAAVEAIVHACMDSSAGDAERDRQLLQLFPSDVRAAKWNRELVQKGMTPAGREFMKIALQAMGCEDRADDIKSVPDLIDFDEGRID